MAEQKTTGSPAREGPRAALHEPDRMIFFTDAVVAIAMTLLALDLPVPDGDTTRAVVDGLRAHLPEYGAFLCSFFVIGGAWSAHHGLLRYARHVDGRALVLNLQWLFFIVVTPFATRLMTEGGGDSSSLRMACYGFVQAVAWGALLRLYRHLRRQDLVIADDSGHLHGWARRRVVFVTLFALSVPLAFLSPWAAGACWAASPFVQTAIRTFEQRRRRSPSPG